MLMTGHDLLSVANANNFAVPAFNVSDYSMQNGLFEICEQKQAPWILAIHPNEVAHIGPEALFAFRERAHRSSTPVAIHWDHGASYEQALSAIQFGFTSVMIDGSMLDFDQNLALTKKVVDSAHAVGLSVEGELGTIGATDGTGEGGADTILYTEPAEAARFVEETGVDSLAVAIGTRHGIYPATLAPELKLDLLQEIKKAVGIPLVLHGGSNNPDDEIAQAVKLGVNKINISSDIKVAYFDQLRTTLTDPGLREPSAIQPDAVEAMQRVAAQKIDLFDAAGKAKLY
jgi:fructose-bisphosphate aldolase class II